MRITLALLAAAAGLAVNGSTASQGAALTRVLAPASPHAMLASPTASHPSSQATAWCQGSQAWQTVRASLGHPVRVKARIATVTYAATAGGRPTFINLGHPYPNRNRLTLVIWGEDRVNFPLPPERMFRPGQVICAQGIASLYRGVPQIEVGLWDGASRLLT